MWGKICKFKNVKHFRGCLLKYCSDLFLHCTHPFYKAVRSFHVRRKPRCDAAPQCRIINSSILQIWDHWGLCTAVLLRVCAVFQRSAWTQTISGISNKCKSSNFPQINPIQSLLQPSVSWPSDILMGQNMLMVATKMAISLAKIYFWCRRKDIIHQSKNGQQISKPKTTDVLKCYNYFFSSLLFWLHRHERGRRMTR